MHPDRRISETLPVDGNRQVIAPGTTPDGTGRPDGHRCDIRHSRSGPPDDPSKKLGIPHGLRSIMRFARQKAGANASHGNQYGFHLRKRPEIRWMGFPKQPKPIRSTKGTVWQSADRRASMD
ncbi:hypothetical protein [Micromonospora sp. WMMD714]|uniref:hypothetical protein n=1 Tax=Micromonospora sp. WMMD714 TaxID=3016097 RepID=UPI00249ACB53|nr:hypothetical protein [Micromonospora sp. WMMD714]WFE64422.1 hypothetical protein O7625_14545 [Micromonospora sp. WMMD714]